MIVPIISWEAEDDGYGVVGYSWTCSACSHLHRFVTPYACHEYFCDKCREMHLSNFEED